MDIARYALQRLPAAEPRFMPLFKAARPSRGALRRNAAQYCFSPDMYVDICAQADILPMLPQRYRSSPAPGALSGTALFQMMPERRLLMLEMQMPCHAVFRLIYAAVQRAAPARAGRSALGTPSRESAMPRDVVSADMLARGVRS
jgi:hypothetical protein